MQDSYENPTPTPPEASAGGDVPPEPTIEPVETTPVAEDATTVEPTPELTDATPTPESTPTVDSTPVEATSAADTTTSSNPFLSSTDPVPAAAPVTPDTSTPITPQPGEKKSNKGIILGVVIGAIVLLLIGVCVFLFLNHDDKKADDNVANNGTNQEEKTEKKEEKKEEKEEPKTNSKTIEVGYAGKSFEATKSFATTIKNAAKNYDLYTESDDYSLTKIEDIDEFLKGTTPGKESVHVYITNEQIDEVIEIVGLSNYEDSTKEAVAITELEIREIWLSAYEPETYTLGGVTLALNKTTVEEIKKAFGEKFEYDEETNVYSYENWNGFDVDLFINDDEDTLYFVTFEPTFE